MTSIDVFQHLRQMQNFNTLMAVVGGLTHSALARLSKTNACIQQDVQMVSFILSIFFQIFYWTGPFCEENVYSVTGFG